MRRTVYIFFLVTLAFSTDAQRVRVAAAANLRYVLESIEKQYEEENPGVNIELTFGSSGTLTQQILNGAPYGESAVNLLKDLIFYYWMNLFLHWMKKCGYLSSRKYSKLIRFLELQP